MQHKLGLGTFVAMGYLGHRIAKISNSYHITAHRAAIQWIAISVCNIQKFSHKGEKHCHIAIQLIVIPLFGQSFDLKGWLPVICKDLGCTTGILNIIIFVTSERSLIS